MNSPRVRGKRAAHRPICEAVRPAFTSSNGSSRCRFLRDAEEGMFSCKLRGFRRVSSTAKGICTVRNRTVLYDGEMLRQQKGHLVCVYRLVAPIVIGAGATMAVTTVIYKFHIAWTVVAELGRRVFGH